MSEPIAPAESPLFDTNQTHTSTPTAGQLSDGFVLDEVPASSLFNFMLNTDGSWLTWLKAKLSLFPGYAVDTTKTIASGIILPTAGNHNIETEGASASDDLTNITTTNLDDGRILVITCLNPSHVVVVKHATGGAGQIHLSDGLDYALNSLSAFLTLKRLGADWYELGRSIQPGIEGPGFIKAYGGDSAPSGYLLCDGMAVSRSVYASLFGVISTNFGGGDGSTTFNVPNFKGRFPRGLADYQDITCTGTPSANTGTFIGHPYKQTGVRVRLTGGSITGLATGTDYWVIVVDSFTLAFATTLANAVANTRINISSNVAAVISQWDDPDAATRATGAPGGANGANVGSLQQDTAYVRGYSRHVSDTSTGGPDYLGFDGTVQGLDTGKETRPLNVAVNYVIKY